MSVAAAPSVRAPAVEIGAGPAAKPWALALVLLLGLLLQLPTLGVGFFADDYVHQLVLADARGFAPIPRWNLYDFGSADAWKEFARERSALPWWTASDWSIRFFRPLSSATLALDHALWGKGALGAHVVNLVLWLGLLVLVHRFFRVLGLTSGTALVGLVVFTLSDASSVPVGWIANRNSLLEALFAVGAVLCALRGRAFGALALAVLAALSKESGALALVLVAALSFRRGQTLAALAGGALFVAHLAFLALAGYGTHSLFYATPWSDTGRFALNAVTLGTGGLLALLGPLPLDLVTLFPAAQIALIAAGIVVGLPLAVWIVRRAPPSSARALALGWTVLFLVPQGGVAPADRLLFVPSIGAAALLALAWSAERARWRDLGRLRRAFDIALALSVTLGSGLSLVAQNADVLPGMARHVRAKALATDVGPAREGKREVLVLQTENQMQAFTLGATWAAEVGGDDVRFWILQSGPRAVRWTRTDERAFEFESLGRPFLDGPFERVYLSSETPPAPGTRFVTPLFSVEVLATDEHGVRRFRVTFERSLDDPSLRFVRPIEGVLTAIATPAVGATVELAEAVPSRPFVP